MRMSLTLAALLLGAGAASAQQKPAPKTAEKSAQKPAQKSAPPKAVPQQPAAPKTAPTTAAAKAAATTTKPAAPPKPGTQLTVATVTDTSSPPPTIYREVYEYSRDGRRDPFNSLLTTNELRPTITDLRLTGILFDHTGRNSVATLRDMTNNTQYRVSVGSTLGRMRVTAIRVLTIVFTIDEFGTTRKDSLTLRDSTKARAK